MILYGITCFILDQYCLQDFCFTNLVPFVTVPIYIGSPGTCRGGPISDLQQFYISIPIDANANLITLL